MDKIEEKNIVDEVEKSFLSYSVSVISSRAIPDLRDGLKPVQRRILYSMYDAGYTPDKPQRKSARIVGEVIGKYHPHGDTSIYDALVRMAQDFSYRYTLVDGQGNFGNMSGDGAAAMRYTESRLSKISLELLRDLNKDTVDFIPNFDETENQPAVLPSRFPNVLVNGTMGIAVGMATNIPPHNLGEVINACVAYIDNREIDTMGLMEYIKGPDFPTGGLILGNSGIKKAYETGRGTITLRCKAEIEEKGGTHQIVITEVPYGTNLSDLKNKIAELYHSKVIEGIVDYFDESNLENGLRIVIPLKRDANPNVILNNLYKHTQLQTTYGIILLMIDEQKPKVLPLRDIISKYINYQKEIIYRRTRYDLGKASERVHILEGYKIALDNLDEVIKIIRGAEADDDAKNKLMSRFGLDDIQANAILELKLRRLTGLERSKIEEELEELLKKIQSLNEILNDENKIYAIIKEELIEIKEKYKDERRTQIDMSAIEYIEDESLIPVQKVAFCLTNKGYIKRMLSDNYKVQNRGGVGIKGMATNDEDFIERLVNAKTHDYILFFSNRGKVYRMKGYEIPEFSRQSKGIPIINLLPLEKDEAIKSILTIDYENETGKNLIFATKKGLVKRTTLEEFNNIRNTGKIAILLKEDDELINVEKTNGDNEIILGSSAGRAVRFNEKEIRVMGRNTSGVRGMALDNSEVIGCEVVYDSEKQEILVVTENGYGKKTLVSEYRLTHRGSKGVKSLNITEKNGKLISLRTVSGEEDLMIITNQGIIIRIDLEQISTLKRATQGVRLINVKDNQTVATVALVEKSAEEEPEDFQ